MKKLNLDEIKACEYQLLSEINLICKKYKLRYTLCGGTLLGAIRHKGFIPWDDDIDIAMPRPDYEKFLKIIKIWNPEIGIACNRTDGRFKDLYAKVYDKNTCIIEGTVNRFGFDCGVYVDVYPIDGLGDSYEEALGCFRESSLRRELLNAVNWKSYIKSKTHAWYYEFIRIPFFGISRLLNPDKLIEQIEDTYIHKNFDASKYVAVVSGSYREKEILPYDVYKDYIEVEFEKEKFMAIKHFDKYLSSIYGDYMQLPPVEKQITHHSFEAYVK